MRERTLVTFAVHPTGGATIDAVVAAARERGHDPGDPVALHQTRIGLTRLKAAVAFYGPMVADSEWTRLKSELKWLSAHLSATRDLDVAIENSKGLPEERMLKAARTDAFDALKEALQSDRYWQWFDGMWDKPEADWRLDRHCLDHGVGDDGPRQSSSV